MPTIKKPLAPKINATEFLSDPLRGTLERKVGKQNLFMEAKRASSKRLEQEVSEQVLDAMVEASYASRTGDLFHLRVHERGDVLESTARVRAARALTACPRRRSWG